MDMKKSRDLWFVAYILLKGIEYKYFKVINNKTVFYFNIEDDKWSELKQEFYNSSASKLKWQIEKLKDLMH
jgi:hypothetical protein